MPYPLGGWKAVWEEKRTKGEMIACEGERGRTVQSKALPASLFHSLENHKLRFEKKAKRPVAKVSVMLRLHKKTFRCHFWFGVKMMMADLSNLSAWSRIPRQHITCSSSDFMWIPAASTGSGHIVGLQYMNPKVRACHLCAWCVWAGQCWSSQ